MCLSSEEKDFEKDSSFIDSFQGFFWGEKIHIFRSVVFVGGMELKSHNFFSRFILLRLIRFFFAFLSCFYRISKHGWVYTRRSGKGASRGTNI